MSENVIIPPYDYNWCDKNKHQSGTEDNFYWLQVWKTHENYKRFLTIPEFKRNINRWDFKDDELPSQI